MDKEKVIKRASNILDEVCDDESKILLYNDNVYTLNYVASILFDLITEDGKEKNLLFNEYLNKLNEIFDDIEENYNSIYNDFEHELCNWHNYKLIIIEEK